MIPEWLVVLLMLYCYANGFLLAWAISHQHEPFWRGFLDVFALRKLRS